MSLSTPQGPPYAPTVAGLGGQPTTIPDVPILAVLIFFYLGGAAGNMSILQLNLRKGHKFIINGLLFGFCMARILTSALRIGAAEHPHNVSLSIAANIFLNAGILIVYIVNLLFAQRILRARQPQLGWHPLIRTAFRILYALIALFLVLVIVFIVLQSYTLDPKLRQTCRDIQLASITYFLIFATVPSLLLAVTFLLPASPRAEHFGEGSLAKKAMVLGVSSTLCVLNAGFKAGANWAAPRPLSNPGWYQSKASLYCFIFVLEILIVYWFLAMRVDRLFHVPDGSSKRKTFLVEGESRETRGFSRDTEPHSHLSMSARDSSDAEKEPDV